MSPENFDVNKLRIASPCSVGWENMKGDDRKRFCARCELNVFNVAGMTTADVGRLVSESDGRICIRLYRRTDGTVIIKDCPVGSRNTHNRLARFAGATLAAMVGLFSISFGQKEDKQIKVDASKLKMTRTANCSLGVVTGNLLDPYGAVIPGAKIHLFDKKKGKWSSETNVAGEFRIAHLAAGEYTLKVFAQGFKTLVVENLKISPVECLELNLQLNVITSFVEMGVVASDGPILETTSAAISTTVSGRKLIDLPR